MSKASAKNASRKNITYKEPRLIQGKRWYVEYYFRHPVTFKWERFRVFEDINRIKTIEYANQLRNNVSRILSEGFNPFELITDDEPQKDWSIQQGILYFKQKWADRGLEKASLTKYNRTADRFICWLVLNGKQHVPVDSITRSNIESYLSQQKSLNSWSNRGYNNELDFLRTIFLFLKKNDLISVNPCSDIGKQKVITTKHKYYDERLFNKIREILPKHDPYLYFACQVVYYLCIRSEKELKYFKIGNIFPDRKQVLITGSDSKTGHDRYIPMPDEMLKIFKERKIFSYPADHYVFSAPPSGSHEKEWHPGPQAFGNGFFSKRFSKARGVLELSSEYTIYSFRHSRAVHLKMDGASDQEIMTIFGHTDFATTAKYLRDLGLTVSAESINQKTRKF